MPAAQTERVVRIEHGSDFRPRLRLVVSNFAQVELSALVEAEAAATQIFAEAGVEAIWSNCPDHQECGGETKGPEFRIRILSQGKGIVTHDPLGVAIPCDRSMGACLFFVFYAPIDDLAERHHVRAGHVLGQVITHEVGHTLLGPNAHAVSGIMQARLPNADLEHLLYFTPGQARRMRAYLMASGNEHTDLYAATVKLSSLIPQARIVFLSILQFHEPTSDGVFQRLTFEKFHGDERSAVLFAYVVDGANVRVVQGRCGFSFSAETFHRLAVMS